MSSPSAPPSATWSPTTGCCSRRRAATRSRSGATSTSSSASATSTPWPRSAVREPQGCICEGCSLAAVKIGILRATGPAGSGLAARLAAKVVVSMANAVRRVGSNFEPVRIEEGSIAQAVQKAAPQALVAAALHHIPASALMDLDKPTLAGDVAVVADDLEAMRATQAMVSAMPELRALDGGPLENAIGLEAFCAVLLTVNLRYGGKATLRLMPTF